MACIRIHHKRKQGALFGLVKWPKQRKDFLIDKEMLKLMEEKSDPKFHK